MCAVAAGQWQGRQAVPDCRHPPAARTRKPENGSTVPRWPYGLRPSYGAHDRELGSRAAVPGAGEEPMSNWRQMMPTTEAYLLDKVLFQLHHHPDDLAAY